MEFYPFLRLQHVRGGEEIIKRIISFEIETVDVFVTNLPPGPLSHRYTTRIGPPLHWLQGNGYTSDGVGSDGGLIRGGQKSLSPSWYLVRLETKMRTVCRQWKEIVDNQIVR